MPLGEDPLVRPLHRVRPAESAGGQERDCAARACGAGRGPEEEEKAGLVCMPDPQKALSISTVGCLEWGYPGHVCFATWGAGTQLRHNLLLLQCP